MVPLFMYAEADRTNIPKLDQQQKTAYDSLVETVNNETTGIYLQTFVFALALILEKQRFC